jgi:glutamate/tyrosine decarboxylase-like PLP-dependent enzyme
LGALVSFFISPAFGASLSDCVAFLSALAGASLEVAGADFSAGAIFSGGADCCAGAGAAAPPGLVPWAAANPLLAISNAAENRNLFLMEILLFGPHLEQFQPG